MLIRTFCLVQLIDEPEELYFIVHCGGVESLPLSIACIRWTMIVVILLLLLHELSDLIGNGDHVQIVRVRQQTHYLFGCNGNFGWRESET